MGEPYHQSWTETDEIDPPLNTDQKGHETHIERCMSIMPFSCYWGWAIAGIIVFTGSLIILDIFENSFAYSELYIILSFIMVWESIIIIWSHNKIKSFKEILIEIVDLPMDQIVWRYDNQNKIIFDDKKMALSGLLMILFAHILSLDYNGIPFQSNISNLFIYFIYYIDCYLLGAGFYIMIMTAFAVNKIGELPLNIKVVFSKKVQIIGVLYSKLTILAASVYIIWEFFT